MVGKTLSHYRILEKIGAGGMGEVYRARDDHLGRDVAVKILPTGTLTGGPDRKRFRKEALALSKLNHPNIETVHDFDTQEGVDFLVMEHIPGVTLNDKLAAGPLPEKEILRLGPQLAEGLAAAHERGVVHRDLKPGNLRVTPDGRLKILDFGLAMLIQPFSPTAPTETLTETQGVVGTLPYMAPEQLLGEKADSRTDLYAAGVVLYEMATGRRPFQETLSTALTEAILHKRPVPPTRMNPAVPLKLEEIILKCLEKDPENRYQAAKELVVDLHRLAAPTTTLAVAVPAAGAARLSRRAWLAVGLAGAAVVLAALVGLNVGGLRERLFGAGPPKIESLAVLPLENLSGDPEQEYFVDGMTEALIAELSKISALKVISRTSAMRYKNTDKSMPQIARELRVDALIEGSVLREGEQVRITVQLIHGPSDKHLWADSYQRELRGILALQSEVARAIATQVRVAVTPEERDRLARARPVNPEAYRLYLQGRYHWNKRTPEGIRKAFEYFRQALEKDPNYALAYTGVADCYIVGGGNYLGLPGSQAYPKAKEAVLRALELDETLAEAHAALAGILTDYERDWSASEREFQFALQRNPSYATAHQWYSELLSNLGRHEEAVAEARKAQDLDPLSLIANTNVGVRFIFARRYDQAVEELRKTLELDADFQRAHFWLGIAYEQKGMFPQAIGSFEKVVELSGRDPRYLAALAHAYAVSGRRGEAERMLGELEKLAKTHYVSAFSRALVYAGLANKKEALAWLEKAYEERSDDMAMLKVDPRFDALRSDPRFQALLRRMNLTD